MVKRRSLVGLVKDLHALGRPARSAPVMIVSLGLLAALFEGLGLILFIPLIQSLGVAPRMDGVLERILAVVLEPIPQAQRTVWLVALVFVLILLKNLTNFANTAVTKAMEGDVAHRLRTRIFEQVLASCIDFCSTRKRSDIATTLSTNSWKAATALSLFYSMVVALVTFVIFMALMAMISPLLTMCTIIFLIVIATGIRSLSRYADSIGQAVVKENKAFGHRMWESVNSLQFIRTFSRERYERDRFAAASWNMRRRLLSLDLLWALPSGISELAIVALIGTLILFTAPAGVGFAALAAFLSLLYRLQGPARVLMQDKVALDGMAPMIDDVAELLEESRLPFVEDGTAEPPARGAGITFANVSFRYAPDEPWALQNVSLTIPAGKTTAIIGQSGAGKSTMLALLLRFHDPQQGQILVGGVPLRSLRLAKWRGRLAIMSQEVNLFHDTIDANIGYGRENATREDIVAAASVANADAFIARLPEGYDTVVGDQGLRLSGGQRQRVALARTVLRDPDILLLDEPTNALDIESERAFQHALQRYSHQRTVVVVAHRLSTVRDADQIIVMEGGKVVEAGPPDKLLHADGRFAQMLGLHGGRDPVGEEAANAVQDH
jgi:ATP-binding cassette, subfamily B, bacterial MsbA